MASAADRRLFIGAAGTIVALDIVTKLVAEAGLRLRTGVPLLGEWLQLRLVYNPGAAFGLHVGPYSRWIFFGIAILAVLLLSRMSRQTQAGELFKQLALGLVAGGATGNLVDRIRSAQGVVDFIDVGVGAYRWPTFNVADMAVSCGAVALAVALWREDGREADPQAASSSQSAPAA